MGSQRASGSVTTAATATAGTTVRRSPASDIGGRAMSSANGSASTAYCFTARNSPSTYGATRGCRAAHQTVAARNSTTNGSVQLCSSTNRLRGVNRNSAAASPPSRPRRV